MKKTIFLSLALFITAIFNYSWGRGNTNLYPTANADTITTLVINADVTVMLVNSENALLEMTGDSAFRKMITLRQTGGTLLISSSKKRDLRRRGVIYVPATLLSKIQVNRSADVRTLYPLQTPKLDIVINAVCKFSISNFGEVNLIETASYRVEQTTEVRMHSANVLPKKPGSDHGLYINKITGTKVN